jgi:Uma2 family endonuclease
MFSLAPHEKCTYEHYCLLPEGDRRELIEGELLVTPAPSEKHQRYSGNIEFELRKYLEESPVGVLYHAPFDVILDTHNVVQPDVLIILQANRSRIVSEGLRGAPDLVIEILSPGTSSRDLVYKRHIYHRFKVPEYWIVDPERDQLHVLTWQEKEYASTLKEATETVSSSLLPGLELQLSKVLR